MWTYSLHSLEGNQPPSDLEYTLFALPSRLGGLGTRIPSKAADGQLESFILVTSSLMDYILSQDREHGNEIIAEQLQSKATVTKLNREKSTKEAKDLHDHLLDSLQRAVDLAREKCASTWLAVLPFTDHGFILHKSAFHDGTALRYCWSPFKLPYKCDMWKWDDCGAWYFLCKGRLPHNKAK